MTQKSFSKCFLKPLPICWIKTIADAVCLSKIIWFTDGMSTPSLKISTVIMKSNSLPLISFCSNRKIASSRSSLLFLPLKCKLFNPFKLSLFERILASSFLLQKINPFNLVPEYPYSKDLLMM